MPIPLLALLVAPVSAALSSITISGLMTTVGILVLIPQVIDAFYDWWQSVDASEEIAALVNKRLAAAGLDLQFPAFNPVLPSGRETVRRTLEAFAVQRINARAGTEFTTLEGLNQDVFLSEVGRAIASQVNARTGSNLVSVWPVDKLQGELKTEVLRQFENRGRYAGGSLFKANSLAQIKTKIAGKYPVLFKAVEAKRNGGYWGPPKDEKHQKRREAGRVRQERYRASHQQVWFQKP